MLLLAYQCVDSLHGTARQHYHDQTALWASGAMKPMRFSREAVESSVRTRKEVLPAQAKM